MSDGVQPAAGAMQQSVTVPFWHVPWEFTIHAAVGTFIFSLIAAVAVLIDFAIHQLEAYNVSGIIIFGLKAGEYALFATDLALFAVFLCRTARRTITHL